KQAVRWKGERGPSRVGEVLLNRGCLVAIPRCLAFVVARERAHECLVVWLRPDVRLAGGDRIVLLAFGAVGLGELLVGGEVAVLDLALGVVDGRAARAAGGVAPERVETAAAGTDPETDEADGEDEREEDEHPLRLAAQAREEHRVLGDA